MSRTNRKARISSIFLSLSLLLSLLSACKPEPQNEPTSPFSALDMASAISASVGDALGSSLEQLDDSNSEKLNTYMEAAYGTGWHRRRFAVACKRAGWTGTGAVNRACSQPPSSVSPVE